MSLNNIPHELRNRDQWVAWRRIVRDGKATKLPVNAATLRAASSTDPADWCSFHEAQHAYERSDGVLAGVAFVFSKEDEYAGIDLDGCVGSDGVVAPEARKILDSLNSYREISPSGRGVKCWVRATLPGGKGRRTTAVDGFDEIEVYDRARTFAMTGRMLSGEERLPLRDAQPEIDAIFERHFPPPPERQDHGPVRPVDASDSEIIDRIRESASGPKFARLWSGNLDEFDGDHSRCDLALCSTLAWWFAGDAARIDRVFQSSGLYRPKWDRPDYRDRTISRAIESCRGEFYGQRTNTPLRVLPGERDVDTPESQPASVDILDFAPTESGRAELFATLFEPQVRVDEAAQWYIYQKHHWAPDNAEALRLTKMCARRCRDLVLEQLGHLDKKDPERVAFMRWSDPASSETSRARSNVLTLAKSERELRVCANDLDQDPYLLCAPNGVINLKTGQLRPGRPEDLITMVTEVEYDTNATAPEFLRVVDEVLSCIKDGNLQSDPGLLDWFQRALGYTLIGNNDDAKFFVTKGTGSNGKNLIMDLFRWVLGTYAYAAQVSTFIKNGQGSSIAQCLVALRGKRLVTISEPEPGDKFNLSRVKSFTGGDTVTGEMKGGGEVSYRPAGTLWFDVNNAPTTADLGYSMFRRIRLIPFEVSFGSTDTCHMPIEKGLQEKLRREGPGVLRWLVEGAMRYLAEGLDDKPRRVIRAALAYKADNDPLALWVEECVEVATDGAFKSSEAWKNYSHWADENGMRGNERMGSKSFYSAMKVRYGTHFDDSRGVANFYIGLALRPVLQTPTRDYY